MRPKEVGTDATAALRISCPVPDTGALAITPRSYSADDARLLKDCAGVIAGTPLEGAAFALTVQAAVDGSRPSPSRSVRASMTRSTWASSSDVQSAGLPLDTTRSGDRNSGHLWGTDLSEPDRMALLEYLNMYWRVASVRGFRITLVAPTGRRHCAERRVTGGQRERAACVRR